MTQTIRRGDFLQFIDVIKVLLITNSSTNSMKNGAITQCSKNETLN